MSERDFMDWASASGAVKHTGQLGGLYWAQAAWKHQQARINQLERELAEARKGAAPRVPLPRDPDYIASIDG